LLGLLPLDKRERLLRAPLARLTPSTITKTNAVLAEVAACQVRGYALDMEEHTEGICAVGVAFLDPLSRAVALSIPVPTTCFKRRRNELMESDCSRAGSRS
jgi:IclR family transcriptional regulator, carbohydrate utilization repressor